MGGSRDLHVGWSSCQALVNLMFRPSQSYRRDIEAAAKPQGNPLLAAIPDLPVTGMEGPGDAEPPAGPSAMPVPPAMGRSHAQQASRSGRQ